MEELKIEFSEPLKLWPEDPRSWDILVKANFPGVYLWTVPDGDYYRTFYVGQRKDIPKRIEAHIRHYLIGTYRIHSIDELRQGILDDAFMPGVHSAFETLHFLDKHRELLTQMLQEVYVFACKIGSATEATDGKEIRERVESALIDLLRHSKSGNGLIENKRRSVNRTERNVDCRFGGSVALAEKIRVRAQGGSCPLRWTDLSCQSIELVGKRHLVDPFHEQLAFANHMHEFDAGQDVSG